MWVTGVQTCALPISAPFAGIVVCLSWNVFAVLVESIHGEGAIHLVRQTIFFIMHLFSNVFTTDIVLFLLAIIYAIFGCPLSYILWYRPLYQAMRFLLTY